MSSPQSESEGEGRRPPVHRRQYIVDKPFQHRLIGTLMSIWLANCLFFTVVLYFFYAGHLTQFYNLVPRPGIMPLLSLPALLATALGFTYVFGFIVLGIIAVYMSNQIAGPLHRTKKCLERIGHGDFSFDLQFRQGDFLRDIPGIFNTMLDGLRRQVETDVEELRAIEAAADDPTELKRLVRKQRERKEAQAGLWPNGAGTGDREPASLAVH